MLAVWPNGPGGSTSSVRTWVARSRSVSYGSGRTAPCTIAPGFARAAASSSSSQRGSGRQSSSVKATSGALARPQPVFRWRAGVPVPGSSRSWRRTPAAASGCVRRRSSDSSPRESWTTTSSQRERSSVCSSRAFRSQRRRRGRSCEGTTTETSLSGGVMTRLFSPGVRVLCVGNMYPPHDLRGGYELTWRSSVLHLRARGDEVRVLTTEYRSPEVERGAELDADVHRELRWYWRDHAFPRLSARERLAIERHNAAAFDALVARFRPEVVAWWAMGGMSLGLVERARRSGLPAVGVVGDEWLRWGPKADGWLRPMRRIPGLAPLAERATGLPARVDLDTAALWLFNSETVRDKTRASGLRLPRSEVVHPGIDDALFRPRAPEPWRWRLLSLGRLDPRKGIDLAVDALALLPSEASLVIQGSGGSEEYRASLGERAAAPGVADRVEFSQLPRERLPGLIAGSDALLFPVQWDEPWGLVPLEAMAVGRPVVATGTGGSREYLRDGDNCLLFAPPDSADALAAALRRLGEDRDLRERLRASGFETAARYTEDAYNKAIARALETAAARRGTG